MTHPLWRRLNLLGVLSLLGLFLLWELAVRTHLLHFEYIPPPSTVVVSGRDLVRSGELQANLGHTLLAALLGWALACAVGVAVGTLLGLLRPVWVYSMASIDALRSLPIVAFVPVAVLLFGFTLEMEVIVAFYAGLWPVLLNTLAGMRAVHPRLLEVSRVIQKAQSLQPEAMFAYIVAIGLSGIVLNAALVAVVAVLFRGQMAAAGETELALIITLLVEIVTKINGLGALLGTAQANFLSAQVYGLLVIAGALGSLVNWAVTRAEGAVSLRMTGRTGNA